MINGIVNNLTKINDLEFIGNGIRTETIVLYKGKMKNLIKNYFCICVCLKVV
jgi:hypothetical protein